MKRVIAVSPRSRKRGGFIDANLEPELSRRFRWRAPPMRAS
jgi:hypothetical protein